MLSYRDVAAIGLISYLPVSIMPLPPFIALLPLLVAGAALLLRPASPAAVATLGKDRTWPLLIILFIASYAISTLFSFDPAGSLHSLVLLFPGLLAVYIYSELATAPHIELLLSRGASLMIVSACGAFLAAALSTGGGAPDEALALLGSPSLVVPNDLLLCVILLPFAGFAISAERGVVARLLPALAIALCFAAILVARSRVCILTLLLVVGFQLYLYRPRYLAPGLIVTGLALLLIDGWLSLGLGGKFLESWVRNERLGIWYIGLAAADEHPLVGVGPGQFEWIYRSGIDTVQLPAWMSVDRRVVPWAHSIYLEALLERGVLGLLAMVALLCAMYGVFRRRLQLAESQYRSFHAAVLPSFCAFLFAGFFELTLQRNWVVTILFVLIAVAVTPSSKGARNVSVDAQWLLVSGRLWLRRIAISSLALCFITGIGGVAVGTDRERVMRDVSEFCQDYIADGRIDEAAVVAERKRACAAAFTQLLDREPLKFFTREGNTEAVARARALMWQADFQALLVYLLPLAASFTLAWMLVAVSLRALRRKGTAE